MSEEKKKVTALILAAGSGSRMGAGIRKQYRLLAGEPVIVHTLRAFLQMEEVTEIILAAPPGEEEECRSLTAGAVSAARNAGRDIPVKVIVGGVHRYDSVLYGLRAAAAEGTEAEDIVLIHDGARPFADHAMIRRLLCDIRQYGAAAAAVPVKDTIRIAGPDGFGIATPDRESLRSMQTPQGFRLRDILEAYEAIVPRTGNDGRYTDPDGSVTAVTDDVFVFMAYRERKVMLTEGSYENIKITTPEDMLLAEQILEERKEARQ